MNDSAHAADLAEPAVGEDLAAGSAARAASWRRHLVIFSALLAAALLLFSSTYWSMVTTWWRSETFAHGFIVVPISVYLALRKRAVLRQYWPRSDSRALFLVAFLGLVWLFGDAADVLGITQLAATGMIAALVVLVLGWRVARELAFPLGFLLLAVPIGEFLVPPLIEFTAWFTVNALQWTGIPVYWEGNRLSLPSGEWSVVKACSGVRYLYATITVALLYVYLNYRSRWRQVGFVLLAVVLAIVANGVRAYGIVMIGHLSGMRLAVGVDHFIYGWVFFALLMVVLFWIGSFLRERNTEADTGRRFNITAATESGSPVSKTLMTALTGLVVMAVFPAWAGYVQSRGADEVSARLVMPHLQDGWQHQPGGVVSSWTPVYVKPTTILSHRYAKGTSVAGLHLAYYGAQQQGSELISFQNVLVKEKEAWHVIARQTIEYEDGGHTYSLAESRLRSAEGDLLVWQWYWVNGSHVGSIYMVKLREAIDKLVSGSRRSAGVIIFTPIDTDVDKARQTLRDFAHSAFGPVDRALTQAAAETR